MEFSPDEEQNETAEKENSEAGINSSSVEGTVNDPILKEPADPEDKHYSKATIEREFEPGIVCVDLTKKFLTLIEDGRMKYFPVWIMSRLSC